MFESKAYVCNRCRKAICYSLTQAGTTVPCPFCGTPANLPVNKDFTPDTPRRKNSGRLVCLLLVLALAGAGICLLLKSGAKADDAVKALLSWSALLQERVTVAPAPVRVRGARATVAVKEMRYGCPDVYYSAVNKTLPTETPVCCLTLEITNTGKQSLEYHAWRNTESNADLQKATLTDVNGASFGLVSFGIETCPLGSWPYADIAPGETATDYVLFICEAKPTNDLTLVLPGGNVGGKGDMHFTIPGGMIQ
jgi:hypothetical protein